eukprot:TRINITY_DN12414_c0_g1_i5.p1 TRINITY_DN12414_c0_g1~~TRINITY_DN12414_c0_g1_i5.p1  ORF type:complete len:153 (+),score=9.23 TRINITY_DN12414_c0_g1_i5:473-931(+)
MPAPLLRSSHPLYRCRMWEARPRFGRCGDTVSSAKVACIRVLKAHHDAAVAFDHAGNTILIPFPICLDFNNSDAIIYVVDSADAERMEEARGELQNMLQDVSSPSCIVLRLHDAGLKPVVDATVMLRNVGITSWRSSARLCQQARCTRSPED